MVRTQSINTTALSLWESRAHGLERECGLQTIYPCYSAKSPHPAATASDLPAGNAVADFGPWIPRSTAGATPRATSAEKARPRPTGVCARPAVNRNQKNPLRRYPAGRGGKFNNPNAHAESYIAQHVSQHGAEDMQTNQEHQGRKIHCPHVWKCLTDELQRRLSNLMDEFDDGVRPTDVRNPRQNHACKHNK